MAAHGGPGGSAGGLESAHGGLRALLEGGGLPTGGLGSCSWGPGAGHGGLGLLPGGPRDPDAAIPGLPGDFGNWLPPPWCPEGTVRPPVLLPWGGRGRGGGRSPCSGAWRGWGGPQRQPLGLDGDRGTLIPPPRGLEGTRDPGLASPGLGGDAGGHPFLPPGTWRGQGAPVPSPGGLGWGGDGGQGDSPLTALGGPGATPDPNPRSSAGPRGPRTPRPGAWRRPGAAGGSARGGC